jgi:hypothetical protein
MNLRRTLVLDLLAVFAAAFLLRLIFNLNLDHRLCEFGDAFYYLSAGSQLLATIEQGQLFQLWHQHAAPGILAMTSTGLIDRLLLDGPIFPAYLALMQFTLGLSVALPQFDTHCVQIGLFNSLLDSASCLLIYGCGRLAFNRPAALTAALLFACYPPAIVNTPVCYSEQFAYFVLLLWCLCLLALNLSVTIPLSVALGILTTVIILAKPAFVLMPLALVPIVAGLLRTSPAVLRDKSSAQAHSRQRVYNALFAGIAAFIIIATPWLAFTAAVSGRPSLVVNRAPAFNLFIGNDLNNDGFRTYPLPYTPADTKEAAEMLWSQFAQAPLPFISMELRKVSRLWAGAWDTFNYTFLLNARGQDIFHQFLLFAAAIGTLRVLGNGPPTTGRRGRAAAALAVIVLVHCAYLAFEPISRYTITAMPFVCILAGVAFTRVPAGEPWRSRYINALLLGLVFIGARRFYPSLAAVFASLNISSPAALQRLDATVWVSAWLLVSFLALRSLQMRNIAVRSLAWTAVAGVVAVLVAGSLGAAETLEWCCPLQPGETIYRQFSVDAPTNHRAVLLVDLCCADLQPPLVACVNGKQLPSPSPWWQIAGNNHELMKALNLQANSAGTNVQNYRQWWAFPLPADTLQPGNNSLELRLSDAGSSGSVLLFGEYTNNAHPDRTLPSLTCTSWTKAFATIVRGDARLRTRLQLHSTAVICKRIVGGQPSTDLSSAPGRQFGDYHAVICQFEQPQPAAAQSVALAIEPLHFVAGNQPPTFFLPGAIRLPAAAEPGTRVIFRATAEAPRRSVSAYMLSVVGFKNGKAFENTCLWQPGYVPISEQPRKVVFSETLPADIVGAKELRLKLLLSPFPSDWLFLRRKQAMKQRMTLRDVHVELLPPAAVDPGKLEAIY